MDRNDIRGEQREQQKRVLTIISGKRKIETARRIEGNRGRDIAPCSNVWAGRRVHGSEREEGWMGIGGWISPESWEQRITGGGGRGEGHLSFLFQAGSLVSYPSILSSSLDRNGKGQPLITGPCLEFFLRPYSRPGLAQIYP